MGGRCFASHVLQLGCGNGSGIPLLFDRFGVRHVDAFDPDPVRLAEAQEKFASDTRVRLWSGLLTAIEADDHSYDAVFDMGALYRIVDWRAAVDEVARVLRPGGRFFFAEPTEKGLGRPVYKALLSPAPGERFDPVTFVGSLEGAGIELDGNVSARLGGDAVVGVGRRTSDDSVA